MSRWLVFSAASPRTVASPTLPVVLMTRIARIGVAPCMELSKSPGAFEEDTVVFSAEWSTDTYILELSLGAFEDGHSGSQCRVVYRHVHSRIVSRRIWRRTQWFSVPSGLQHVHSRIVSRRIWRRTQWFSAPSGLLTNSIPICLLARLKTDTENFDAEWFIDMFNPDLLLARLKTDTEGFDAKWFIDMFNPDLIVGAFADGPRRLPAEKVFQGWGHADAQRSNINLRKMRHQGARAHCALRLGLRRFADCYGLSVIKLSVQLRAAGEVRGGFLF